MACLPSELPRKPAARALIERPFAAGAVAEGQARSRTWPAQPAGRSRPPARLRVVCCPGSQQALLFVESGPAITERLFKLQDHRSRSRPLPFAPLNCHAGATLATFLCARPKVPEQGAAGWRCYHISRTGNSNVQPASFPSSQPTPANVSVHRVTPALSHGRTIAPPAPQLSSTTTHPPSACQGFQLLAVDGHRLFAGARRRYCAARPADAGFALHQHCQR